jgi:streptogramin lyase
VASATTAVAVLILAGLTLLEGPGLHSPAFRLGEWWMGWVGSPWLTGGLWLVFGGCGAVALLRWSGTRSGPTIGRRRLGLAAGGLVVAVSGTVIMAPAPHIAIASGLSAAGAVLLAGAIATRWSPRLARPTGVAAVLDPRRVHAFLLPLVLWGALCAGRGMLVHMFTPPSEFPPGVERIALRTGIFALQTDDDGGRIYFTDRSRTEVGVLDLTGGGRSRTWNLNDAGVDAVEELGGPIDGTLWVSAGRWNPAPAMGLMPIDLETGPGEYRAVSGCWIASWIPMPDAAASRVDGGLPGDVLLGCEADAAVYVFRPSLGRTVARIPLPDDVEAGVFDPRGRSLYGISLWGEPSVIRYGFPSGRRLATAPVGPFNWAVALDTHGVLWVSRFFEGSALLFDSKTLELTGRVPLSFGVRAMIYEPVRDRIWAAAAYSGKIWEVEASPPHRRRAFALCGQARDLRSDARGRIVVATDCGIFRLDPEEMEPIS